MNALPNQVLGEYGALHPDISFLLGRKAKELIEKYFRDSSPESAPSRRARGFAIKQLAQWCREQSLRVQHIEQAHIADLEQVLKKGRFPDTAKNLINRICNFLTWLAEQKLTKGDPANNWMSERRLQRRLPSLDKRNRLPKVIQAAGSRVEQCYCEFFADLDIPAIQRRTSANAFSIFCAWCEKHNIKFLQIDGETYRAYVWHLAKHRTKGSLYAYLRDIRRVFSWLTKRRLFKRNPFVGPIAWVYQAEKKIVGASAANLEQVLKAGDESSALQLRDQLTIALSVYCFLSGYDLEQLTINSYQERKGRNSLRLQSRDYGSSYERRVLLDSTTERSLKQYLAIISKRNSAGKAPLLRALDVQGNLSSERLAVRSVAREALRREWLRIFHCAQPSLRSLRSVVVKERLRHGHSLSQIAREVGLPYHKLCGELTDDLKEESVLGSTEDAEMVPYELLDDDGDLPSCLTSADLHIQREVYRFINRRRGASRKAYANYLGDFFRWCAQADITLKQFDDKVIAQFASEIAATSGEGTVANKRKALRALYRHLRKTTALTPKARRRLDLPRVVQTQLVEPPSFVTKAGARYVASFRNFVAGSSWSYTTIQHRSYHFSQFSDWAECQGIELGDLCYQHIQRFIADSAAQVSLRHAEELVRTLRALFDWFMEAGLMDRTPIPSHTKHLAGLRSKLHKNQQLPILTEKQVDQLFSSFNRKLMVDLRDRAALGIMLFAFARSQSLHTLAVKDFQVRSTKRWLRLLHGDLEYEVPAHSRLTEYLEEYIERANIREPEHYPLLRSLAGRGGHSVVLPYRLTPASLSNIAKKRLLAVGIDLPGAAKLLRLTGLAALLKGGVPLEEARALGGFKDFGRAVLWRRPVDLTVMNLDTIIMAEDQAASRFVTDFIKQSGMFSFDVEQYRMGS